MNRNLIILLNVFLIPVSSDLFAEAPSFRRDVMPVFFRAGCNSGTCHGSARGKDGFMLSLFGYDARGDYFRLTQELIGRRVNVAAPSESLILKKASGQVPHTGGKRFDVESPYYQTLLKWIEAGAPDDPANVPEPVEIKLEPDRLLFDVGAKPKPTVVTARYSDGTTRDVSKLALFVSNNPDAATISADGVVTPGKRGDTFVFARFNRFTIGSEVIVLPKDSAYQWSNPPAANYIDELVYDRLQKLHLLPSELCDDETFVRRVYLDLAGVPPTVEQYRTFLNDANSKKRDALVDQLLASEEFSQVWTAIWAEWVRLMGGGYAPTGTDVKAAEAYYQWIHEQIKSNRPFNEFVADQVTATGSNLTNGPANLYTMLVHNTRFTPKEFAANFSQLTMGIQIQCAECHNHPFDRWTMNDYYGFVSFFTGMKRKLGAEPREMYIFNDRSMAPAKHLVDDRPVPATVLGGEAAVPEMGDKRQALAAWLAAPDNPHFGRNFSNRIWAHFFGRGLVEPVDDMRISNPPTNKPLLDALAKRFAESKFNLRTLVRDICTSRVYQLSSQPNGTNSGDTRQFSRSRLRRLRADVLLDAIVVATSSERGFSYFPRGTKAIQYYPRTPGDTEGPNAGDPFFATFGRSRRGSICVCETRTESNLSQALHLLVGDTIDGRVGGGQVVPKLLAAGKSPEEIIEEMFVRTLSRKPTSEERAAMRDLVGDNVKDRKVYEDIFGSLLQSTEFGFNH
ncbi:MAG: DUF1549 and DUF1553 domain-containing protein [Planctomycetia bacterium]|nr:DUF1549 and DUF1553 domain-containing protein [Planctomycetia bacterium]